jgi:hypothetical protein
MFVMCYYAKAHCNEQENIANTEKGKHYDSKDLERDVGRL